MSAASAFIRERLDGYIAELSDFVRIPSVSSQGRGISEAANWLIAALARRGVAARVHETRGNPVVVGTIGSGESTLLLYNHYDVQPAEPLESWTSPPFEPALRDGKLYGRGIIDDKGEIIARLAALDALLARHSGALPCKLIFFAEGEEESGSPNLEPFVAANRKLLAANACLWEAGTVDERGRPLVWLGLRGLLAVELTVRTMHHDAHSGWAHALPNAAWRLIEALGTLRDPSGDVAVDGFCDDVTGPTLRQRELLEAMPDEGPALRSEYGIQRSPGGREGLALREAVFRPTCNITGFISGHTSEGTKTVIPASARATLDFRLVPNQDPERCFEALKSHLVRRGFGDVIVQAHENMQRAACSDPDHPFVRAAVETLREAYATDPVVAPLAGGTGPAAYVARHLRLPFASIGCSYPGARKHAPDENIRLDDFVRGAGAIAEIIERYVGSATLSRPSSMTASR